MRTQTPTAGCGTDAWWCQTITVTAEYHPTWNKPTQITQPATVDGKAAGVWTMTYNAQGLLATQTGPVVWDGRNGVNAQPVWRTWYDSLGRVTRTQDPTGIETAQVWGGAGQPAFCLTQSRTGSQSGGPNLATNYQCNAVGDVTRVTDPRGHATNTTYDALRRPTASQGPAGRASRARRSMIWTAVRCWRTPGTPRQRCGARPPRPSHPPASR